MVIFFFPPVLVHLKDITLFWSCSHQNSNTLQDSQVRALSVERGRSPPDSRISGVAGEWVVHSALRWFCYPFRIPSAHPVASLCNLRSVQFWILSVCLDLKYCLHRIWKYLKVLNIIISHMSLILSSFYGEHNSVGS